MHQFVGDVLMQEGDSECVQLDGNLPDVEAVDGAGDHVIPADMMRPLTDGVNKASVPLGGTCHVVHHSSFPFFKFHRILL